MAYTWTDTDVVPEDDFDTVAHAIEPLELGGTVGAGDPIFQHTDELWYQLDTDGANQPANTSKLAIALTGGAVGQVIAGVTKNGIKINYGTSVFTKTDIVIGDGTAGGLEPAGNIVATEYLVQLGYAETDDVLVTDFKVTGQVKA